MALFLAYTVPPPQNSTTQNHGHAQPLAHAHTSLLLQPQQVGIGLAEELGGEAKHAIAKQEGGRHLALLALFAGIEPQQHKQQQQAQPPPSQQLPQQLPQQPSQQQQAPQTPESGVRRSTRTSRPPERYSPSLYYLLLIDSGEPECYEEVMQFES